MRKRTYKFRLYVAGDAQNSGLAITNLNTICRAHLAGRNEIEVIDVLREPKRGLADSIFMTPTLVVCAPGPKRKIIGTLSHTDTVMQALGLETHVA